MFQWESLIPFQMGITGNGGKHKSGNLYQCIFRYGRYKWLSVIHNLLTWQVKKCLAQARYWFRLNKKTLFLVTSQKTFFLVT